MNKQTSILGTLTIAFMLIITSNVKADGLDSPVVNPQVTDAVTTPSTRAIQPFVITTINHTKTNPVWITIYNTFGMITDSGCVYPGTSRDWSPYMPVMNYEVRSEMMEGKDCAGRKIHDDSTYAIGQLLTFGENIDIYEGNIVKESCKLQPFNHAAALNAVTP